MTADRAEVVRAAAVHLAAADQHLAPVIARVGACTIEPHDRHFQALAGSVISQQLSVKAAATITGRFQALFGGTFPDAAAVAAADREAMRAAGLSYQKIAYIQDLAAGVLGGTVQLDRMDTLPDDEVIRELTAVKGFGVWTVQMFLMFGLGRLDVVAAGDLGVRNGVQRLYGLDHVPSPAEIDAVARDNGWHPYASIACWYVWQSLKDA